MNHPFYNNTYPPAPALAPATNPNPETPVITDDFVQLIKLYIELDNQLHEGRSAMKLIQSKKEDTEKILVQYMKQNKMEDKEFNLTDGKLKYTMSRSTAPVNREHILNRLQTYLKNKDIAAKATDYIFADRQVTFTPKLKRTTQRKKN